jgi:hypothetical protein
VKLNVPPAFVTPDNAPFVEFKETPPGKEPTDTETTKVPPAASVTFGCVNVEAFAPRVIEPKEPAAAPKTGPTFGVKPSSNVAANPDGFSYLIS